MTIKLTQSNVQFVNGDQSYSFQGVQYKEAVVASPLVEEGSGQGLGHPETSRTFVAKKTLNQQIPVWRFTAESVAKEIQVREVNTRVQPGDWIVRRVTDKGAKTLIKWQSEMEGVILGKPRIRFSERTNTLSIKLDTYELVTTDAEKYRGFGKWRGNGGFLRNIKITNGNDVVFNPNTPLKDESGNLLQVEHVVGGEEYKTLTYVTSLLASKLPEGTAKWNAATGQWEDSEELEKLIEREATRVTVQRWNIEDSVYEMFKAMYGDDKNFKFNDKKNEVIHLNAWCWVGTQTNIVEVPLTRTFMGRCNMFAEHIHYLGTELPALYTQLLELQKGRQKMVKDALNMALQNVPAKALAVIDSETLVVEGKLGVTLAEPNDEGDVYVDTISIPGELTLETVAKLQRKIEKQGFAGVSILIEEKDYELFLNLDLFRRLSGSAAEKGGRSLLELLTHLEIDVEDRLYDNWEGHLFRLARSIEANLEGLVANSSSLLAKAAKTPDIAFTCRVGGTLDASVGLKELHISSVMASKWGLEEGDIVVPGRVPVPGMGSLTVVYNDAVPYGTVNMASATQHAIQEGDQDGDSTVFLAFSKDGALRIPPQRGRAVNPISD